MASFEYKSKVYEVDDDCFLVHPDHWDEAYAEGMAPNTGISGELTPAHWEVIKFIRMGFTEKGRCPMVHETCRAQHLRSTQLSALFPAGYLRGACKLAGLTYKAEDIHLSSKPKKDLTQVSVPLEKRVYRVNVWGFLIDPSEWDEDYAVLKSRQMKMPESLTEKHWQIIRFLRTQYEETGKIPTVFETCAANQIEVEELGELFPDGYHRGAVKIAGLPY